MLSVPPVNIDHPWLFATSNDIPTLPVEPVYILAPNALLLLAVVFGL